MPSPFPGMNPYLERVAVWKKFHTHFKTTTMTRLAAQVRPRYAVDIETQLYIHEPPADRRFRGSGGVTVATTKGGGFGGIGPAGAIAVAPVSLTMADDVEIEKVHHLVVRDRDGNEVVTVLELLGRANEYAGPDREQ